MSTLETKRSVEVELDPDFPPARMATCVEREIRQRERVYPKLVELGKMTGRAAQDEIACMRALLALVRQVETQTPAPPARQADLFGAGGQRR